MSIEKQKDYKTVFQCLTLFVYIRTNKTHHLLSLGRRWPLTHIEDPSFYMYYMYD